MPATPFVSYAQNGEDVVLWRALGSVTRGVYVDVGAAHPSELSVTRALYDRDWHGLNIEPVDAFADLLEHYRPRDVTVRALAGSDEGSATLFQIDGTGLSTVDEDIARQHALNGYEVQPVERPVHRLDVLIDEHLGQQPLHLLKIDVEGAEPAVLAGIDLTRVRPWVLVVEATAPLSTRSTHDLWEPALVSAGYRFCLFDGLSRYYVAEEHAEQLAPALSYPACPLDNWVPAELAESRQSAVDLRDEALLWRAEALARAAELSRLSRTSGSAAAMSVVAENRLLHEEVAWLRGMNEELDGQIRAIGRTLSWRITKPLRVVKGLQRRRAAGSA